LYASNTDRALTNEPGACDVAITNEVFAGSRLSTFTKFRAIIKNRV
jgi:hypothetical protein